MTALPLSPETLALLGVRACGCSEEALCAEGAHLLLAVVDAARARDWPSWHDAREAYAGHRHPLTPATAATVATKGRDEMTTDPQKLKELGRQGWELHGAELQDAIDNLRRYGVGVVAIVAHVDGPGTWDVRIDASAGMGVEAIPDMAPHLHEFHRELVEAGHAVIPPRPTTEGEVL